MEARLRKLQTEEEKMSRHISEARKQQDFVLTMKQEKER